jgi:hypothetical protein
MLDYILIIAFTGGIKPPAYDWGRRNSESLITRSSTACCGRGIIVCVISAQDIERYRQCLSSIDVPLDQKDEMIAIVHAIMSHFVDQAYGVQTDQITLQSASKSRFQAAFYHASIGNNPTNQIVDAKSNGVENDSTFQEPSAP